MLEILGKGPYFYTAEVNSNKALIYGNGTPAWPASGGTSGGFYAVTGAATGVTAASLASGTTLMAMRFSTSSSRKAYVTKIRFDIVVSTLGTSGLIAGALGVQRFSGATPSGAMVRTPCRFSETSGNTSDMTTVRDSEAALTVTSVNFGTTIASTLVPICIQTGGTMFEWIVEPFVPIILNPGDGLCLRTQTAMPATQTWAYAYTVFWSEE